MRIVIETIPHEKQRYNTVGDWWTEEVPYPTPDWIWQVRVSRLHEKVGLFPEKFAFLVAFHELVEMALCAAAGVTEHEVDRFDFRYIGRQDEPGDDENAPYYQQHQIASGLERTMAALLGVDWIEYEKAIAEAAAGR